MHTYLALYAPFMISFLSTYLLVPVCKYFACYLNILDIPNSTIKRHKNPIPYLGGVAILLGFSCSFLIFAHSYQEFLSFFFGVLLLFVVGLIDDIYSLSPLHKTLGQCIASCWFIIESIYLKRLFFDHHLWLIPLLFFWVVLITNAFNLIDVLDGLATCVAINASLGFFLITIIFNQSHIATIISSMIGALVAFFLYNKPPASIYMGDAGSLLLGGFFAILPFFITWNVHNTYGFLSALLILAIPIIEVGMLVVIRTYNNIPFYKASPHHFSHYLLAHQHSKHTILCFTTIFCWIHILIGICWATNAFSAITTIILTALILISWVGLILRPFKIF